MMFEREDWEEYGTIKGLYANAGVPNDKIFALVAKELMDNALDASTKCEIEEVDNDGFIIKDNGPGFDPEVVADLFSIGRPLKSTKLLRLPTRGARGNGLRVVASAVLVTRGTLIITTRGQTMKLTPLADGTTAKELIEYNGNGNGSLIEVHLGPDAGPVNLQWAEMARQLSSGEQQYYKGKTSPHWYNSDDFYRLCLAAKDMTIYKLIREFEGCNRSDKIRSITNEFKGKQATDITLEEAKTLLKQIQDISEPIKPKNLGYIGNILEDKSNYVKVPGEFELESNNEKVKIPYIIEAWTELNEHAAISININRTPITGEVSTGYFDKTLRLSGCNLSDALHVFPIEIGKHPINVTLNIITPFIPITTTSKSPDLSYFKSGITEAIQNSARKAKKSAPKDHSRLQTEIVLKNISEGILKAGGGYAFSLRQLYYVIRPIVKTVLNEELTYANFATGITTYENNNGAIPKMYRDDRGALYHPHKNETIALGTRMVDSYTPPKWTFNKVLYIEKEGFFQLLQEVKWPEKHDCALLTSKGQATRAAKDLIDLFGNSKEDITFYCVHDADAAGTIIYNALQNETKARPARNVNIVNLGLEPEEGLAMGLEYETLEQQRSKKTGRLIIKPVADYVPLECKEWLQTHRIEVNAMSSTQFIDWLDAKMEKYGHGKLIASANVMIQELHDKTRELLRQAIIDEILEENDIDGLVDDEYDRLKPLLDEKANALITSVTIALEKNPIQSWREPIAKTAADIVETCDY